MTEDDLKETVQDCNLNFLLGSGLSCPFLTTLGNLESLLTQVEESTAEARQKAIVKASLYHHYFNSVISKNIQILESAPSAEEVSAQYELFLSRLNSILLKRKSTILSKEVNLFTTNIDIFLDRALEDLNLEYNDGFNGRFEPTFGLTNFKKSRFKKSLHYDKTAELPVFNLMKLHGSLSWQLAHDDVTFCVDLRHIRQVATKALTSDRLVEVPSGATIDALFKAAEKKIADASTDAFMTAYEDLLIVINPTKDKFKHTLLNQTYYELLRLYSNELEKENTLLFVMGFSFADEHIRQITVRAANSNPTLMIKVVAHTEKSKHDIQAQLGHDTLTNNNLEIVAPEQEAGSGGVKVDKFKFDFKTINERIFDTLLKNIECE